MLRAIALTAGVVLSAACGDDDPERVEVVVSLVLPEPDGVDREGTRDNIIDGLAESGFEVGEACVDDALDVYDDDELEAINEQLDAGDYTGDAEDLLNALIECAEL